MFDGLVEEALGAYDRVVGLEFDDASLDGSQHKAPFGGEGHGPKPHGQRQVRLEVVRAVRPLGHPPRLVH